MKFMKIVVLLLMCTTFSFNCSPKKKTVSKELINRMVNSYLAHKSVSMKITVKMKFFHYGFKRMDTTSESLRFEAVRAKDDSIFKCSFSCSYEKTKIFYDLKAVYSNQMSFGREFVRIEVNKVITPEANSILRGVEYFMIKTFFVKPQYALSDTKLSKIDFSEEELDGKQYYVLNYNGKDFKSFSESMNTLWIDKKDLILKKLIQKYKQSIKYKNSDEPEKFYDNNFEISVDEIVFDKVTIDDILKSQSEALAKSKVVADTSYLLFKPKPLKKDSAAPNFEGSIFSKANTVQLTDFKNHTILLYFWQESCFPCDKAIPYLNKLNEKFKRKGLITLGVILQTNDNAKQISKHIKEQNFKFPVILTDKKIRKLYGVYSMPTIYVLDKKGKIIYSQFGFDENTIDSLSDIIKSNL